MKRARDILRQARRTLSASHSSLSWTLEAISEASQDEALRGHFRPNRVLGAVTLRMLRKPRGWIHRRVESVAVSDPVVVERRVSLDFTLGKERPVAINGAGEEVHFVPLALMRKQPMVNFSLQDEFGKAVPILTARRNGALSVSILVVMAEALARADDSPIESRAFPMPREVIADLWSIVFDDPLEDAALKRRILDSTRHEGELQSSSLSWRRFLVEDEEFKKALRMFSDRFLLTVALTGKPGVRRILKYSFEEHGDQPKMRLPRPIRWLEQGWARLISGRAEPADVYHRAWWLWLLRGLGWKPMASEIKTPSMGQGGSYHLEVEAPKGLQITLAQLRTDSGKVVAECATSRQRVHLYSDQNEPGYAVFAARPRPFTIVRTGLLVSLFSVGVLALAFAFSGHLVEDIGPVVSLLLLLPTGLAAYIARPIDQPATNEAVLGLRLMAGLAGLWPLLAAIVLVVGSDCYAITTKLGQPVANACDSWGLQEVVLGILLGIAILNCLLLFVYLTLVMRPREQERVDMALKGADAAP